MSCYTDGDFNEGSCTVEDSYPCGSKILRLRFPFLDLEEEFL